MFSLSRQNHLSKIRISVTKKFGCGKYCIIICFVHFRVFELRQELEQTQRAKDQLERVTYTLVDEMRQIKSKLEAQNMDFTSVTSDLRNKSQRLEEENRSTVSKNFDFTMEID